MNKPTYLGDRRWPVFLALCMLIVLLSVASSAQSSEAAGATPAAPLRNPFTTDFNAVKADFVHSSAPKQAVLIARGYKLREFVDTPGEIGVWLNSVASDNAAHPLVRDEALRYLAAIDVHTANLAAAEEKFKILGLIRHWSLISAPVGTEDLTSDVQQNWQHVDSSAAQLWTDIPAAARANGVVYAATSVYSDSARTVALRFGADSAIAVSVNGASVFSRNESSTAVFDQHAVTIQLLPGWNSLVLRFTSTGEGPLRFAARITALAGGGVPLKTSANCKRISSDVPVTVAAGTVPDDLVEMARAEFASDPSSAGKQQTLGLIEHEHARGPALDHLQAAARRDSTSGAWLEVAAACEDAPCTFAALNSALRADPKNERAVSALADYYISRDQLDKARDLLRTAAALVPEDFVTRQRLAEVYAKAGLNTLALKQTRALQALYPAPLWLKMMAARRYAQLGFTNNAAGLLRSVLRDDFDNSDARKLLAELLRRTNDDAGLQALLKENSRLNPRGSDSLSAQVDASTPAARLIPQANDADAPYLENAFELAAAARRDSSFDNASAVALSDVRVERVLDNGLSSVHVQQIWYIATDQGAREYASQPVQYAPATQQLRILHARVHKRDGQVVEGSDGGDARVADPSLAMYYDVRSREVRIPGVEKGDVVELDYSITPTSYTNPYGDYFGNLVVFRTSVPERLKRYVLIAPAKRKLNVVEKRMPEGATIIERNGERIYRWEARDLPALVKETRGPSVTDVAPYVHVSSFASWSELGQWYAEMLRPQLTLDANLHNVAAQLVAGQNTEFDKVNAIYQFVLRNTHYVGLEFGIYSYKPYPVTQTYARGYGDCKDKASLMIALLHDAGIDADFALLRTRRMGEIDPRAASIALFNHAIVYLPKWDLWLDGTAEYFNSRELPVDDQGAMALVVDVNGASSLRQVPITRPEDNYTRRIVHATLQADGAIRFQGETYTRGEDAPGLRREYESTDHQRDSVRNSLAQVFPSVRVDDVRVRDGNDPEPGVNVDFKGTLDTFYGKKTVSLATSWMDRSYVQPLAPLASRVQELTLPAPWTTEEELHFQLPATARIVSLPANTELSTQFGTARIRYERRGREIVIRTSLQVRALRVAPGDYTAFRDFCRTVENAFRKQIDVNIGGS